MRRERTWMLAAIVALAQAYGYASVPRTPAPKVVQIVIDKVAFGEPPSGIVVGDTVEWVNMDIFDHTSTSKTGGWDVVVPAGKKARVVMRKAGAFDYSCRYHPNMTGTIRVKK